MKRKIEELQPQELLALAIAIEQANQKTLRGYAEMFAGRDEEVSKNFEEMSEEEARHEEYLQQKFAKMFKGPLPAVEHFDMDEVMEKVDLDDSEHLILDSHHPQRVFLQVLEAEKKAKDFYLVASRTVKDHVLANLFHELAEMEGDHAEWLEMKLYPDKYGSHP